jgi:hypothetical protein
VGEDAGEKLEWVGQGVVVELVSGLGLVEEQSGVPVESESGKVDGGPNPAIAGFVGARMR